MAYNKKNWQDNVSDITAAELNRMEQGIYDNSLVVEAIKDTINPTDTETYKTAELTEGQITDVIGVSNILIKGQTSQNGEPTPSSPVDVNVVSGSNVINIREGKINKNNIIHVYSQSNLTSFISNPRATSTYFECKPNTTYKILRSEIIQRGNFRITSSPALEGAYTNFVNGANVTEVSITSGNQDKYIVIYYHWEGDSEASSDEVLDTLSAYELPGKELPLDLPVENLCPISSMSTINGGYINTSTGNLGSVIVGKTYTLSFKNNSSYTANIALRIIYDNTYSTETSANLVANGLITYTFTASHSGTVALSGKVEKDVTNIFTELQLEQGSKANAYTPYGTDPIELCKIGNYQDYFYKSGSKWYLHKEIGKKVIDGTESWNYYSTGRYFYNSTILNDIPRSASSKVAISFASNRFVYTGAVGSPSDNQIILVQQPDRNNEVDIRYDSIGDVVADFKNWLSANNISVYHSLVTPTDTEITNTTLISQLEAIYNAPLYEQTNITQTNNDLPMVLDITACKDNINGIKAFIRK